MTLNDRLTAPGPKRILSLDGGGVRGMITLCILERIEQMLRVRTGRPTLKLCDYFDLIGGTSTGSIISAGLAIGMEVSEIKSLYRQMGSRVFGRYKTRVWSALYDEKPLDLLLRDLLGNRTFGDSSIRTGICIFTKRADTNSLWPLINHPDGKYFGENRKILLRDAVRASAAAPVYFSPQQMDIGLGKPGTFVDGGVSMANNPALQLFLAATLKGFPFHWQTGEEKLFLLSVGTGIWQWNVDALAMAKSNSWNWLVHMPKMLIQDGGSQAELLLQYLSRSPTNRVIDEEVGDLSSDLLTPQPVLSYIRYNVALEQESLKQMGLARLIPRLEALRSLCSSDTMADLMQVGERGSERCVKDDHFPRAFDLKYT